MTGEHECPPFLGLALGHDRCDDCGQPIRWRERVWYVDTGRLFLMIHEHCPPVWTPISIEGTGRPTRQLSLPFLAAVPEEETR